MSNSLTEVFREFIKFQMEHPDDSAADARILRDDYDSDNDDSFESMFRQFQKETYQPEPETIGV